MRSILVQAVAGAAALSVVVAARSAEAASGDPCANLSGEDNAIPTLYVENGDTQEPMIKKLGKLLMQSSTKLRLVYRNRPTCNIRSDLFNGAQMLTVVDGTTARPVRYIPASASFDPATAAPTCTVPDA